MRFRTVPRCHIDFESRIDQPAWNWIRFLAMAYHLTKLCVKAIYEDQSKNKICLRQVSNQVELTSSPRPISAASYYLYSIAGAMLSA